MKKLSLKSVKRILVVGSWAKEQISIENIRRLNDVEIYAYMDTRNPGIEELVDGYEIDNLYDVQKIRKYAQKVKANLLIVTTAAPLSVGVADALEKKGIAVFGPNRVAARLESDKSFARDLMKKHGIDAIPTYETFTDFGSAMEYARSLDWKVAVKPLSLTDGLGVRVFGDQLTTSAEVIDYIDNVLRKGGDGARVIIEEKLDGEEFSLQCMLNGEHIVPTLTVQDFKKLLPGDEGVNTASMGSYSGKGHLLPFMKEKDYEEALSIMRRTVRAFRKETGLECRGFLYGQFMLTPRGIRLIEYNFRPGDPEWLNTMSVMKSNLLKVIVELLNRKTPKIRFERKSTVCKYVVPMGYPEHKNEVLDFRYDKREMKKNGVDVLYSCGVDGDGKIRVGTERGIALVSKGDTIFEAQRNIERSIANATGNFYYRPDIGTRQVIRSKMAAVNKLRKRRSKIKPSIRTANEDDFLRIHKFVKQCDTIETYPKHLFKIITRYLGNTCLVAEMGDRIIGYAMGMRSQRDPETFFLWQIGVSSGLRGKGVARELVESMERRARGLGCSKVEVTIDPLNRQSYSLFEGMDYVNVSEREGETVKVGSKVAAKNYYKAGRHFIVYWKTL